MDTKKLRQKILDLAIRGKLVPQDPNDEPASVLLERIRAEKERLIAEGKIKRPKKPKASSAESHYQNFEPPFPIPESWEWATVGEVSSTILYGVSESAKPNGKYKLLRITDIQDNNVIWDNVPFTNFDSSKAEHYILQNGDILFARTGATVGKSYLVREVHLNSIYASYLIRIRTSNEICPKYLKLFFESGYYWQQISEGSVGIGQPNVNGTLLGQLLLPIPPKAEQIRIINKAESLTELISSIDVWTVNLSRSIEQTKNKILDLAMQGKLVPQDPTDEPAADMLRRINPKAKIITDNPHSWNIPSSWTWCYLGDIFQHNTGKALNSSNKDGIDYEYITTSNVYWGRFVLGDLNKMPFKENEIEKCTVCKGDLLVCEGGDIGRAAIWNLEKNIMIQNHLHRLRPLTNEICTALYFHVFRLYKDRDLIGGKGIALQGFSSKSLHHLIVPLPPSNEQKRIAIQIEELYSTFYEIEASLQS